MDEFQASYGPCDALDFPLAISGEDIEDLGPLQGLVRVGSENSHGLNITDNPSLTSLEGLESLETVYGILSVTQNPSITSLTGLSGLEYISQRLIVANNENLTSLQGLGPDLTLQWLLRIAGNPKLTTLSGLSELDFGSWPNIEIVSSHGLLNLQGLPAFERLGAVVVWGNDKLVSFEGLIANSTIPVSLNVQQNKALKNFKGLEWLTSAENIRVTNNASLENFVGLENLAKAKRLDVTSNPSLASMQGLGSLAQLYDEHTDIPPDDPFVGYLIVRQNPALESLDGLDSLISARNIQVSHNPLLSDCSALAPLLDVVDHDAPGPGPGVQTQIPFVPDVLNEVSIGSNAPGCENKEDVVATPAVERTMTGSWFNPSSAGEGFMIHAVQEHKSNPFNPQFGLAVGYYYGYDENGDRFWLIGVHEGEMNWNEPIEFVATRASGGTFEGFDPGAISEQTWGSFTFTPGYCDGGIITLSGQFDGLGPVEKSLNVTRLGTVAGDFCAGQEWTNFSDSLTASWFDPSTSGQGLAIHKIDDETGIVYFYGFDAAGDPLWLIGVWSGPVELAQPLEIQMIQVSGGTFSEIDPENIVEEPWGVLRLIMEDCPTGTAELDGLDGKQTLAIEQLAPSLGLECR